MKIIASVPAHPQLEAVQFLVMERFGLALLMSVVLCSGSALAAEPKATDADIARITAMIKAQPTADKYAERARLHIIRKEYHQGTDDATKAIRLAPKKALYYVDRAVCLSQLKQLEEAIADCNSAIKFSAYGSREYIDALGLRADAYDDLHRYDKAMADAQILLKLGDPSAPAAIQDYQREMAKEAAGK